MSTSGKKPPFSSEDDDTDFLEIDAFGPVEDGAFSSPDRMRTQVASVDSISRKSALTLDQERAIKLGISHATTVIEQLPAGKVAVLELPDGKRAVLNKSVTVIGRAAGVADVVLDGDGVSRQHAAIVYANGGFFIEDLESSNGTKVNGERVTLAPLTSGMQLSLGRVPLRFILREM
jgi:hypothetical protein